MGRGASVFPTSFFPQQMNTRKYTLSQRVEIKRPLWERILICLGHCDKILQVERQKRQVHALPCFWKVALQEEGVARLGLLRSFSLHKAIISVSP